SRSFTSHAPEPRRKEAWYDRLDSVCCDGVHPVCHGSIEMNLSTLFPFLSAAAFLLAIVALAMLAASNRFRRQSGLPKGEVVYEDASGLAGESLVSRRLGLSGKPDYLLEDRDGSLIPIEVKSGYAPRGDQPHESHLLQLAAYFFLIEDVLRRPTRYGLIRYR